MAEFQPDPFLTSLGLSIDEQRAYDAYCDAIVDASEEEMRKTGVTYTLDEIFEHAHEEIERLKREYPREDWGRPCSQQHSHPNSTRRIRTSRDTSFSYTTTTRH